MNPVVSPSVLGEILSFGLAMAREGYEESTIRPCIRALKAIAKRAKLLEPDSVKAYLAMAQISEGRKEKLAGDLARFYRYRHTPFQKPHYDRIDKLPFVPLESEVDQLVSEGRSCLHPRNWGMLSDEDTWAKKLILVDQNMPPPIRGEQKDMRRESLRIRRLHYMTAYCLIDRLSIPKFTYGIRPKPTLRNPSWGKMAPEI